MNERAPTDNPCAGCGHDMDDHVRADDGSLACSRCACEDFFPVVD